LKEKFVIGTLVQILEMMIQSLGNDDAFWQQLFEKHH